MKFEEFIRVSRDHYLSLCPNMQNDEILHHASLDYRSYIDINNAINNNEARFIEKTKNGYLYEIAGKEFTMTDVIQLAKLPE